MIKWCSLIYPLYILTKISKSHKKALSSRENQTLEQIIRNQTRTLLPVFTEYAQLNDVLDKMLLNKALKPIAESILNTSDFNQNEDEEAIFRPKPKIAPDEDFQTPTKNTI